MKKTLKFTGVAAEYNGQYWGIQYQDGTSTVYDFGPIENAEISNPSYCTKPEDMTYQGSPYINQLKHARLVNIIRTTVYETIE